MHALAKGLLGRGVPCTPGGAGAAGPSSMAWGGANSTSRCPGAQAVGPEHGAQLGPRPQTWAGGQGLGAAGQALGRGFALAVGQALGRGFALAARGGAPGRGFALAVGPRAWARAPAPVPGFPGRGVPPGAGEGALPRRRAKRGAMGPTARARRGAGHFPQAPRARRAARALGKAWGGRGTPAGPRLPERGVPRSCPRCGAPRLGAGRPAQLPSLWGPGPRRGPAFTSPRGRPPPERGLRSGRWGPQSWTIEGRPAKRPAAEASLGLSKAPGAPAPGGPAPWRKARPAEAGLGREKALA